MYNIATGASQNHSKSLLQFIRSAYANIKDEFNLYVYDLGLSEDFLKLIRKFYPKAIIQTFDYSKYPEYYNINVNAGEYAWKSAIIKEVSDMTDGYLLWCDAGNMIQPIFNFKLLGELLDMYKVYSTTSSGNVRRWTHPKVLEKFGIEDNSPILNIQNKNGAIFAFNLKCKESREFIDTFANLSSKKEYIAPPGSDRSNHRQDQALFTILYYCFCQRYGIHYSDMYLGITIHNDCD
jgi:hypothetical protein